MNETGNSNKRRQRDEDDEEEYDESIGSQSSEEASSQNVPEGLSTHHPIPAVARESDTQKRMRLTREKQELALARVMHILDGEKAQREFQQREKEFQQREKEILDEESRERVRKEFARTSERYRAEESSRRVRKEMARELARERREEDRAYEEELRAWREANPEEVARQKAEQEAEKERERRAEKEEAERVRLNELHRKLRYTDPRRDFNAELEDGGAAAATAGDGGDNGPQLSREERILQLKKEWVIGVAKPFSLMWSSHGFIVRSYGSGATHYQTRIGEYRPVAEVSDSKKGKGPQVRGLCRDLEQKTIATKGETVITASAWKKKHSYNTRSAQLSTPHDSSVGKVAHFAKVVRGEASRLNVEMDSMPPKAYEKLFEYFHALGIKFKCPKLPEQHRNTCCNPDHVQATVDWETFA